MANSLIVGYTKQDESRGVAWLVLPVRGHPRATGSVYTSFGFEPFTPNNELRYNTFQMQNNFTQVRREARADIRRAAPSGTTRRTCSSRARRASTSTTRSTDFYTDANGYLANPNRTTSPVTLRRFQVRLEQHPRAGEADPAAGSLLHGRLRAGRLAGLRTT